MEYFITNQTSLFDNLENNIKSCSIDFMFNYFRNHDYIEFDSETDGFNCYDNKLLFIQFGDSENQFVIDIGSINVLQFKSFLEKENVTFIMQNAKFDLRFLYVKGIYPKKIYDTYLAESILHLGDKMHSKSLYSLCYNYLGITLDKSVRADIAKEGATSRVIHYSAADVKYLTKIMKLQKVLLEKEELTRAVDLENAFVRVLAYVEVCGFKLNIDKWKAKMKIDENILHNYLKQLDNWIIDNKMEKYIDYQLDLFSADLKTSINWSSSKQVSKLFKELGLNVLDKHGKVSVDSKVISPQKDKHPIVPIYLKYKGAEKVVSTYGQTFLDNVNTKTGRIHTNFTQLMDTSRLSSGGNNTINFQNIPAVPEFKEEGIIYARECFEPEKGNNFIVCDYAGQESVIFANKCLDRNLLDFYDSGGGDMHSYVAKLCYPSVLREVPLEKVKKVRKDLRQNAKAAGFALQFGGVGATIANNLGISKAEGDEVEAAYYRAFPGVKDYFDKVTKLALETGEIIYNDKTKHKRKFTNIKVLKELEKDFKKDDFWSKYRQEKSKGSDDFYNYYQPKVKEYFKLKGIIERTAKNAPVQGTAASMTKLALILIFKKLELDNKLGKVLIPNIIHDEVVCECVEVESEYWANIVQDCMEKAGAYFCQRVPLKAEPYIGKDWTH